MSNVFQITPQVLGHQSNALRIECRVPRIRCQLRPKDDTGVIIRDTRPSNIADFWSNFDNCISDDCKACPIYKLHKARVTPFIDTVIRRDKDGDWHLMNHQHKGWDSFSFWYRSLPDLVSSWGIRLGNPAKDEFGEYYPAFIDRTE